VVTRALILINVVVFFLELGLPQASVIPTFLFIQRCSGAG
jgi:hypothetical protein